MGALQAKENIWYVGVQDPGLRVFDIIMHSDHGTSYNSYIVKGTEKTVLFETSKEPFFEEFLANIREVCDPASLDYIVVNHTEPDHTGSMKRLLELAWVFAALLLAAGAAWVRENGFFKAALIMAAAQLVASVLSGSYGRKQLGGMSGDIAGFAIVWGELAAVLSLAVIQGWI